MRTMTLSERCQLQEKVDETNDTLPIYREQMSLQSFPYNNPVSRDSMTDINIGLEARKRQPRTGMKSPRGTNVLR
ncbi:hypothetical protein LSTR_LSTR011886 [Laodelphax striatellus]|uniref:Uncharacterized protein n=1 Tax=Laodelphax striatellus TaxID=195883 RepID=A0A482XR06_LAOST|nr:hypothetical protein LSTR_LSTR011886 [Laodelphax striatellus]